MWKSSTSVNVCSQFEHDVSYYAERSQKPLNAGQKPIVFYESIIELFSIKEEWILDGLSKTGKYFI